MCKRNAHRYCLRMPDTEHRILNTEYQHRIPGAEYRAPVYDKMSRNSVSRFAMHSTKNLTMGVEACSL